MVQGFEMSEKDWGNLCHHPTMWEIDGIERSMPTKAQ